MSRLKFFLLSLLTACSSVDYSSAKPTIVVPLPPYVSFVQEIVGNEMTVISAVPPGFDEHTYEPTPQLLSAITKATIFFTLDLSYEKKALASITSMNPSLKVVDLLDDLPLIADTEEEDTHHHSHHHCEHCHDAVDKHVWMSPELMIAQITTITKSLCEMFPEQSALFMQRSELMQQKLQQLDQELTQLLTPYRGHSIAISHPALGYFCREYGLEQIAIEIDGKDPLPKQLAATKDLIEKNKLRFIFVEPQFSQKGAAAIASQLDLAIVEIDPLSQDYYSELKKIAAAIVTYANK